MNGFFFMEIYSKKNFAVAVFINRSRKVLYSKAGDV